MNKIWSPTIVSLLLCAGSAAADPAICDYRVVTNGDGTSSFEWIPCAPPTPTPTSGPAPPASGTTAPAGSEQLCDYRVIAQADGSWSYEWIPCPVPNTGADPSAAGGANASAANQAAFLANKNRARNFLRSHRSALKKAARNELGLTISDSDFQNAESSVANAQLLDADQWNAFVSQHPECAGAQGCTDANQNIFLKDDGSQALTDSWTRLIEHEALHAVLGFAEASSGMPLTEQQEHDFIDRFLGP